MKHEAEIRIFNLYMCYTQIETYINEIAKILVGKKTRESD
ncbi:MAG: hypothetical protein PWP15_409 [Methanothermococcus sp.]|jgi:hypothetical protein|nr:hypothetical protein [Methanothermococcus sp.]MDK2987336.1 hypothetical protein [Methanothermococcus sp.]